MGRFTPRSEFRDDVARRVQGEAPSRPEFLDKADEVLRAQGHLAAFKEDMKRARYPKKERELAQLEERAVEMLLYSNHTRCGSPRFPRT